MRADKLEAKLKALVKAGANRRCVNCDSVVRRPGEGEAGAMRRRGSGPAGGGPAISGCPPPDHPRRRLPQGPQYVVCSFNVFVCTVCSGVQ